MDLGLKDKVVIVTGGSKGIGAGISRSMACEGAVTVIVNRNRDTKGTELEAELKGQGLRAEFVPADLVNVQECKAVIDHVMEKYGRIDVIINNAGGNNQVSLAAEPEAFMKGLQDNLIHYYAMVHYAHDELIKNHGSVVNIGSHVAVTGQGGTSAYAAAKGAINGLTREWAAYFADKGVRVNCLIPGSVWTSSYVKWAANFPDPDARRRLAEEKIPFGHRMTTIEEFADLVVYVASPRAGHLTGELIINDGGYCRLDRALT